MCLRYPILACLPLKQQPLAVSFELYPNVSRIIIARIIMLSCCYFIGSNCLFDQQTFYCSQVYVYGNLLPEPFTENGNHLELSYCFLFYFLFFLSKNEGVHLLLLCIYLKYFFKKKKVRKLYRYNFQSFERLFVILI